MSKFEKYLGKGFEIEVDGEKLQLDVQMQDISKIMASQKKGEITEESAQKMVDTFINIIGRSYPEENKKAINAFLLRNFVEFTTAFVEELGWADKGEMNKSFLNKGKK